MKMPARGWMRTALVSSSAGLLLGVPLACFAPTGLRGSEPVGPTVVRGQSTEDGGIFSRWMGNRSAAAATAQPQPQPASPDLNEALAQGPQQNPSMFGRLLGSSDPNSPEMSRSMSRAQQKMFRRNPQLMQMYMMQQQLQLLKQQQQLQQTYEEEAVPDHETFDDLSIDPLEWADAPGRKITEQVPAQPSTKPWWETGEAPLNARRRTSTDEGGVDPLPNGANPAPAAPPQPAATTEIPDLFPVGATTPSAPAPAPVVAAPVPSAAPAPAPLAPLTPAASAPAPSAPAAPMPAAPAAPAPVAAAPVELPPEPAFAPAASADAPTAAAPAAPAPTAAPRARRSLPEDFGLTFPDDVPQSPPPAGPTAPAAMPQTAQAAPTAAPESSTPSPFPAETAAAPPTPVAAPAPLATPAPTAPDAAITPAPLDFIPPEPIGEPQKTTAAPLSSPSDAAPAAVEEPFFAPASPATVPVAPAAPARIAAKPVEIGSEPQLAGPAEDEFFPPAPSDSVSEAAAEQPPAFPEADAAPAEAPFIPEMPLEAPAAPAPAFTTEPAAEAPPAALPATEMPSPAPADDNPFTGLTLDEIPLAPLQESPPATLETPLVEPPPALQPEAPSRRTAEPFTIPSEGAAAPQMPAEAEPEPEYQFAPEPAVAESKPAPFIPPEPEDFGGTFGFRAPQPAPPAGSYREAGLAPPSIAASDTLVPDAAPNEYLAPDITAWTPEPMQAPDPIVAPSTARKLVVAPPPTPQETRAKIDRISSRKGLNGFKGFCPVALKDHRELLDARPEYSAVYNGRRYFFSSGAAQAMFDGNPEEYIPAAMGNDVVHLMLTGESAQGSLDHAVWFRSKLYMFTSAETMETFVAAPSIHAREE